MSFQAAQGFFSSLAFGFFARQVLARGRVVLPVLGEVGVQGRRTRLFVPRLADVAGYRAMFDDFLDALETGEPPRMDAARARRDLELVEEIYRSPGWNASTRRRE